MDKNIGKLNKTLITGLIVINIFLLTAYFGEYLKGQRPIEYIAQFYCFTSVPSLLNYFFYRTHRESTKLKYAVLAGYLVTYTFALYTGSTIAVFTYILPMLSLIMLYHSPKLVLELGAVTIADNLIFDYIEYTQGKISTENSKDYEIQISILFTCFLFLYFASRVYDDITHENESFIGQLDENNRQLQHVTLQTITTIANIIDAKDEYTKGHSYRVAEYSSSLARALGFSDAKVQDIKYIGLLHDIGKIGVPDSILNKPGRLNDAEFSVMRSHVEIGGRILSGNNMIEGVDAGASYHHERWDGKGYPKGLKGREIPEIARIIGIADAYDAMTSNRVYRKRLTDEDVAAELRRCCGSQFDPEYCEVFIRLLEDGTIKQLSPDICYEERGDSLIEQSSELLRSILDYSSSRENDTIHDYLTRSFSLKAGEKLIEESLMKNDGGLFISDITNIRSTNEKYGLLAGDHVIRTAADVLNSHENIITARYSGDQFLCFIPGIRDTNEFEELLENICSEISDSVSSLPESVSNQTAVGAVLSSELGRDLPSLITAADKALYHVKQNRKTGYYIYSRSRNKKSDRNLSKLDLEQLIRGIEDDAYTGIYNVDYEEFTHIYNFIRNICTRNSQQLQLVLITMTESPGSSADVSERDKAMALLDSVINRTLRKIDVMFRFSSSQFIILLNNTGRENVEIITGRILSSFYRQYDRKDMDLSFVAADLNNGNEIS